MRLVHLFVLLCAVLVSCGEVPTPAPTPTPTMLTVQEYATTCAELMSDEMAFDAQRKRKFIKWVDELLAVKAPPEYAAFHRVLTIRFSSQIEAGGPNSKAQAAYTRQIEIVNAMPDKLRRVLIDDGCIDNVDVLYGWSILAARERITARGPAPNLPTIRSYAEHCGDVMKTVPRMDTEEAVMAHMVKGLSHLVPPPRLERYNKYVVDVYRYWHENGMDSAVPGVLLLALSEVEKLDPATLEILVEADCIKR